MGFEPTTSSLATRRSTTELHPRITFTYCSVPLRAYLCRVTASRLPWCILVTCGAGDGDRTHDLDLGKVAHYHSATPAYQ